MARPAKFPAEAILDAAGEVAVQRWRDATVADVAQRLGAPAGSLYYRFPTREELFVSLWLRAVERFHVGLLEAAAQPDPRQAAVDCAVHIPRFCRDHPVDAVALTLYRQGELVQTAPAGLRERVEHVNDEVVMAMRRLTRRRYGRAGARELELVATACQESPYGLVRRYLRSGRPVPGWLDAVVVASTTAILALGDDPER